MIGIVQAFQIGFWDKLVLLAPLFIIMTILGFALFWRPGWYDKMTNGECDKRDSNPHMDEV